MRIVIQCVKRAELKSGLIQVTIGPGLAVLAGIAKTDTERDADYLAGKLIDLRLFGDTSGKMNRSIAEHGGEILIVPDFTLYGDCRKGRKPDFGMAAPPEKARVLYEYFVEAVGNKFSHVQTGVFQAYMEVELVNDGPVTLICDSDMSRALRAV